MPHNSVRKFARIMRAASPQFVRQSWRFARSITAKKQSSPALSEELVKNCRMCANRHDMLDLLPAQAKVCEVGTYKGDFARAILKQCQPDELHLLDIDYSYFSASDLEVDAVKIHQGHSVSLLGAFENAYFDWIYIDADHSYEAVRKDALAAAPKIRPSGFMVFNDYAHIDQNLGRYGVHRAATEFAVENNWSVAFFAYQGNGLYDIAFKKPAE